MRRLPRALSLLLFLGACSQARSSQTGEPGRPLRSAEEFPPTASAPSGSASFDAGPPAARTGDAATVLPALGSTVPVDAGPSYDLAADLVAKRALAKKELGPHATGVVVSDVFLLVYPEGPSEAVALQRSREGERIVRAFMDGRFSNKPFRAVAAYLFTQSAAYQGFCQRTTGKACISPFGYYEPDTRRIIMNGAGLYGTFTHEIVHTFVEADFPEAPTWLNEGIASVFEQPYYDATGIHGAKNWRYPRLMSGLATEPQSLRLANLLAMSDETFRGQKEDLHYAFARYVCQWLDTQGKLWPFYHRYRDTFAKDATGALAFESVVGKKPEELDGAFRAWVRAL